MKEIEIRILDVDPHEVKARLRGLGARPLGRKNFKRIIFPVSESKVWARLRTEGKRTTFALKVMKGLAMNQTHEYETEVGDFITAARIFCKALPHHFYEENVREDYGLYGAQISLDKWPKLPYFIEIEAKSKATVKRVQKALSLRKGRSIEGLRSSDVYEYYGIDSQKYMRRNDAKLARMLSHRGKHDSRPKEIETKILDVNVPQVKKRLKAIGAKYVVTHNFRRVWLPAEDNEGRTTWLRTRTNGRESSITLKERYGRDFDQTYEYETGVADFETMARIFCIVFPVWNFTANKREEYRLGSTTIVIDRWPEIPPLVEIEAPDKRKLLDAYKRLAIKGKVVGNVGAGQIYPRYGKRLDKVTRLETLAFKRKLGL